MKIQDTDWFDHLKPILTKNIPNLKLWLKEELQKTSAVLPPADCIFKAFELTSLENTKVVILGQDPYPDRRQATGLAFAVRNGMGRPPSLKNIIKELESDLNTEIPPDASDLTGWASQGVLLLNSALTVRQGFPRSHTKEWLGFTKDIISLISDKKKSVVFILWGNHAKSFIPLIDRNKHAILESAHPSPLSCSKFFGCRHFSKANEHLVKFGLEPINWKNIDGLGENTYERFFGIS